MANTENESLGRGNLLKTLTSQGNTSASNLPAYDIWSRDSKSLPPISPSQLSRDDSLTEFNASHYNSSIFPSIFQRLNTKPIQRAKMNTDLNEVTPNRPKIARSQKKSRTSFFDEMQHRNESQYLRIQAVAKEQMEIYEKYSREMEEKIRRQREEMKKKAQRFLDKLAYQEEKKKEDNIYRSSFGRIWRHHRIMQRRALNLEPMNASSSKNNKTDIT